MAAPTWKILGDPDAPAESRQRFFERDDQGGVYICDSSGDTPSLTDDGPLRIVENGKIEIGADYCTVTVFVERDGEISRAPCSHRALLWLSRQGWIAKADVYVSNSTAMLADLLADVAGQLVKK